MKDGQSPDASLADWAQISKLRRVYENAQLAAVRELLKNPKKMPVALENALAEAGATGGDLEDLLLNFAPKN
jgi:hypothetical protein